MQNILVSIKDSALALDILKTDNQRKTNSTWMKKDWINIFVWTWRSTEVRLVYKDSV